MTARDVLAKFGARLLVCLGVSIAYFFGAFEPFDLELNDARLRTLSREASGDIIVVAIDGSSIQELGVWPWPRSLHAALIDRLDESGAREIAFDIDFSSRSSEREDAALEDSLARAGGRVILAAFRQPTLDPGRFVYSEPLPRFRRHARLASVNVRPDSDGLVRRMASGGISSDGGAIGTFAALFGGRSLDHLPPVFYIDYSIRHSTVPQVSYADVLAGRVDPVLFAGKRVIVGATAIELGDMVPVPVWRTLPGVLVQVLAAESIQQDRLLQRLPFWISAVMLGALVFAFAPAFARWSWQRGLVAVSGIAVGANGTALAIQGAWPVLIDTMPFMVAGMLCYGAAMVSRIEQQTVRLLIQNLALDRQNQLMRGIVDHSFDAIVTTDSTGAIFSFNPAAERLFGHQAAELRGYNIGEILLSSEDVPAATGDADGVLACCARAGRPLEAMGKSRSGTIIPIELAVTEMRDHGMQIYIALIRDIGPRKQAEQLAAQARLRLLDAIESLSEGFVLYDVEGRMVLCNENFRRMFQAVGEVVGPGWRFADMMSAYARSGDVPEAGADPDAWAAAMIARHENPGQPYELALADGRWLQFSEQRTTEGGVAAIVSDITDRVRRERELQRAKDEAELANRGKTEFLANMSHELRTPLNAVIGFAEVMEGQLFGPLGHDNYRNYARDIRSSGEHLLAVINDILDMARIEAGKVVLTEEAIEVSEAVAAVVRLISQRAETGGLTLTQEIDPVLPQLTADMRLVKQCLINLVSNAVKFTPEGGRVEIAARLDAGGEMIITVRDTGIGIAPEDMDRVMAPFGQAYGALDRRYEGTGLGLPLVKSYVELHGGRLQLDSTPGVGTTVRLVFPAARVILPAVPRRPAVPA